jgi:type IV pilus assembly protein PilM
MASSDQILAIDVGAWSIKLGEFDNAQDGLTMKQFSYGEYSAHMTDENRGVLIKETLQKLLDEKTYLSKTVYLSLSSQLAFTRFVKLPPIDENEERVKQIVEFEARQHVPFDMNEVIWDYQLIGTGEELDVMFVVIKNEIVNEITNAIESFGLKVELVDVASSTCYNAARANRIGDDSCAMVLSIGSRCSNLIFADGDHFFSRNIPIAGHAISQQIAKEFGIGTEEAEELKQRHGFVALGGAYEEPESEVAATISKIVRNVMTRLHGEVNRSINIYRSQQKGNKPVKLFLAGGSSTMAFTETFFQDKLRLDVEYLNPFQGIRLGDDIDRSMLAEKAHLYSEVIGIALRVSVCPVEISLVSEDQKTEKEFSGKKPFFYFSALIAILIPLVFFAGSTRQRAYIESKIKKDGNEVSKRDKYLVRIEESQKKAKKYLEKFAKLKNLDERKYRCVEVFQKIEEFVPNGMWITEVIPIEGDINKQAAADSDEDPLFEDRPARSASKRGRRLNQLAAQRAQAARRGQSNVELGQGKQISGFTLKGYFIKSKDKDGNEKEIDTVLYEYVNTLSLKAPNIQEKAELTFVKDFNKSKVVTNLINFEIQIALYKPIGKQ